LIDADEQEHKLAFFLDRCEGTLAAAALDSVHRLMLLECSTSRSLGVAARFTAD
jgi:hypothetical protein